MGVAYHSKRVDEAIDADKEHGFELNGEVHNRNRPIVLKAGRRLMSSHHSQPFDAIVIRTSA